MAQLVKNSPAMQETWVQSLGREDPLEKGMATHSSILAWRIPWTEQPGGLGAMVQLFKLVLEKAEEPEIKLPTSVGSLKKQESSRETSTSA